MKVTLNELLHNDSLTEIKTASELFFTQALAYSVKHLMTDTVLDVSNVSIATQLAHCPFVADCLEDGLHFAGVTRNFASPYTSAPCVDDHSATFLKRFNAYISAFHRFSDGAPTELFDCGFFQVDETDDEHLTIYNTDIARIYGTTVTACNPDAYVYALAMLVVVAYIAGKHFTVTLKPDTAKQVYEYAHVYTLMLMGNKMLSVLDVQIEDDTMELDRQRWAALVFERRLRGYYLPESIHKYTVAEKSNAVRNEKLRPGDVILVYKSMQDALHNDLASTVFSTCEAGVILNLEKDGCETIGLTVQLLETLATRATVETFIREGIAAGNKLYFNADKKKCNKPVKVYTFETTGVCNCAGSDKTVLMLIPDGVQDEKSPNYEQWLVQSRDGKETKKQTLDIYDTIYTTFSDRDMQFDRQRYRERYMGDRIPEYEVRMQAIFGDDYKEGQHVEFG